MIIFGRLARAQQWVGGRRKIVCGDVRWWE